MPPYIAKSSSPPVRPRSYSFSGSMRSWASAGSFVASEVCSSCARLPCPPLHVLKATYILHAGHAPGAALQARLYACAICRAYSVGNVAALPSLFGTTRRHRNLRDGLTVDPLRLQATVINACPHISPP